jgi:hypothetical protein
MLMKICIFWDKKTNLAFRFVLSVINATQLCGGDQWYRKPLVPRETHVHWTLRIHWQTFTYNFVSNIHYTGGNLNQNDNDDRSVCVWLLFYIKWAIFQLYHDPHGIESDIKHHSPNPSSYQFIIEDKINNFHVFSVQETFYFMYINFLLPCFLSNASSTLSV